MFSTKAPPEVSPAASLTASPMSSSRTITSPQPQLICSGARTHCPPAKDTDLLQPKQTTQTAHSKRQQEDARRPCRPGLGPLSSPKAPRRRGIIMPSMTPPLAHERRTTPRTLKAHTQPSPPPSPRTQRRSYRQDIARLLAQHRQLRKRLPPALHGLPAELMEAANLLGHNGPPVAPEVIARVDEVLQTLKTALRDNASCGGATDAAGVPHSMFAAEHHGHFYSAEAAFAAPREHHAAIGSGSNTVAATAYPPQESSPHGDGITADLQQPVLQSSIGVPATAASTLKSVTNAISFRARPTCDSRCNSHSPPRECDARGSHSARQLPTARSPRAGYRSPLRTPPGSARTPKHSLHTPIRFVCPAFPLPAVPSVPSMPVLATTVSPSRTVQLSPTRSRSPRVTRTGAESDVVGVATPGTPSLLSQVPTWAWPRSPVSAASVTDVPPASVHAVSASCTSTTKPPVTARCRLSSPNVNDCSKSGSCSTEGDKAHFVALPTPSRAKRSLPLQAVARTPVATSPAKVRVSSPSMILGTNTTASTVKISPPPTPTVPGGPGCSAQAWTTSLVHTTTSAVAVPSTQAASSSPPALMLRAASPHSTGAPSKTRGCSPMMPYV